MSVKIHSIALLLLSVYLCCQFSAARHVTKRRPCCVQVTSRNLSAEVVGETFREQAAGAPCVKAVIFNTNDGPLCADPKARWVKDLTPTMTKV